LLVGHLAEAGQGKEAGKVSGRQERCQEGRKGVGNRYYDFNYRNIGSRQLCGKSSWILLRASWGEQETSCLASNEIHGRAVEGVSGTATCLLSGHFLPLLPWRLVLPAAVQPEVLFRMPPDEARRMPKRLIGLILRRWLHLPWCSLALPGRRPIARFLHGSARPCERPSHGK